MPRRDKLEPAGHSFGCLNLLPSACRSQRGLGIDTDSVSARESARAEFAPHCPPESVRLNSPGSPVRPAGLPHFEGAALAFLAVCRPSAIPMSCEQTLKDIRGSQAQLQ
jgi:hypothetical protein